MTTTTNKGNGHATSTGTDGSHMIADAIVQSQSTSASAPDDPTNLGIALGGAALTLGTMRVERLSETLGWTGTTRVAQLIFAIANALPNESDAELLKYLGHAKTVLGAFARSARRSAIPWREVLRRSAAMEWRAMTPAEADRLRAEIIELASDAVDVGASTSGT